MSTSTIPRKAQAQAQAQSTEAQSQRSFHEKQARRIRDAHRQETTEAQRRIRVLLHREQWYVVRTTQLATVVVHTMRRYARDRRLAPAQVATAVLSTFDARCHAGDLPAQGLTAAGEKVAAALAERLDAPGAEAVAADALCSVLGQQCRVTGWLPGVRVLDGDRAVSLTGDVCPNCGLNPVVFDEGRSRCLNREDCGWDARPARRSRSAARRARAKQQKQQYISPGK